MSDRLRSSFDRFAKTRPKPTAAAASSPVKTSWLNDRHLPRMLEVTAEGFDPLRWAAGHHAFLLEELDRCGALLIRGLNLGSVEAFQRFTSAVAPQLMDYSERSTPRSEVSGKVYTSTEYPPDQPIPLHNELSYSSIWPLKIAFLCVTPAEEGGETPIADSRKVYLSIDPQVRDRFERLQVMYLRNFGDGPGLTWQEAFQTDEPAKVEEYCRQTGVDFEWKSGGRLQTRSVRPAVAQHFEIGSTVWFNQAHLHHVSSLDADTRESLLELLAPEDLPFNTFYGDGSEIGVEELNEVRRAFEANTVALPWQQGDLLLLDNMRVAHGRRPFAGPRKVVVAMAEPSSEGQPSI